MIAGASSSSIELWARYSGPGRVALTAVLALIACALLIGALRLAAPVRPRPYGSRVLGTILVLWPVSIVAFLAAVSLYVAQFQHDYPDFVSPGNPILPVTLSAAVLTFLVVSIAGRGERRERLLGAVMAALAAPMIFELPFDLMVLARTTPPVLPHPWLWRILFFAPLIVVELCTIALLLGVPTVRITRWTGLALAALFLVFAGWASIGLGYPDRPLPHVANVVAKLCAFAVAWTMVLRLPPRTRLRADGDGGLAPGPLLGG